MIIIAIIAIFFVLTFSILLILDRKNNNRQMSTYIDIMFNSDDVMQSLEDAQGMYKKKSIAYLAIDEAIFYLKNSVLRDYATAFQIIEKCFPQQEVKKMHESLLQNEKNKIVYLLAS